MEAVERWMVFGSLVLFSLQDLRKRRLDLRCLAVMIVGGLILAGLRNTDEILLWCGDLLPGICLLGLAYVSREAIGYGDGWLVLGICLIQGAKKTVPLLLGALALTVIGGCLRYGILRNSWKREIPFVPFLLLAAILQWILLASGG